jgi:hypothetical protein
MRSLIFLLVLTACSSAQQLSDEAKNIEVLVNKPASGCHTVGKVVGSHKEGSKELALNDALNQAAKLDATALHVNQEVPNGKVMKVFATAYKCD